MIKKILFSLFLLSVFTYNHAQDLQIIDQGTIIVNGSYVYVEGNPSSFDISKNLWVFNNSGQDLDVRVTRIEIDYVAGTENATCWEVCPPADPSGTIPSNTSAYIVTIADNDYEYSFAAHLYPEGQSGCSHFRYIFSDAAAGISDSVDVYFSHGESCVQVANTTELEATKEFSMSLYPNPAKNIINLNIKDLKADADIVITNILGAVIYRKKVSSTVHSKKEVKLEDFDNGLYFVSVISAGQTLATKRFQVVK